MIPVDGGRLLADLRELAQIGAFETGVDRIAFSPADIEARRWLVGKLRAAGLDASMDRVGNVLGRDPVAAEAVLIGSHTDTVPRGGWLDGALGVVYGLEIARASLQARAEVRIGIDVISFQDEEGTYLSCFGSRSFCGGIEANEIDAAKSPDGVPLRKALESVADERSLHRIDRLRHICYLEAHIEQGPRLEAAGQHIAVVTGLVGIRRFRIRAIGHSDHAGTTPMAMRRDAGAALIDFAASVIEEFASHGAAETVWNIGSISFHPGAANVVPGRAELVLEFRDIKSTVLDVLENIVAEKVRQSAQGAVRLEAEAISRIAPTEMSPKLGRLIADAAQAHGETAMVVPSGAGHDAMFLARLIPSAMMFVPSIGGQSHDIAENTSDADIVLGCKVLAEAISRICAMPDLRKMLSES